MDYSTETYRGVRRSHKRLLLAVYVLGLLTLPLVDLLAYVSLRITGVYFTYWSQVSCDEIDGDCHVFVVDAATLPFRVLEVKLNEKLHYIRPPSGG